MSVSSSGDERGPFLIILRPRYQRAALVIFSFFFSFFIYSEKATVWCRQGTEGLRDRVGRTVSEVSAWNGDPEKARRNEAKEEGRKIGKRRGREDGRGSVRRGVFLARTGERSRARASLVLLPFLFSHIVYTQRLHPY